jgi:hypothetical protein
MRQPNTSFLSRITSLLFILIGAVTIATATDPIDLSGTWQLALDSDDRMLASAPSQWTFNDTIPLPGTTDLAQKGTHITSSKPFQYHLTREWEHLGPAFYSRSITIPESWEDQTVELFLERVMWQSRVWIDGKETSPAQDSLNTPHLHKLGQLTPGRHQVVIRVDNRMIHPIGNKSHAYGDQTQSIWNGIVGKIELRAKPASHLGLIRVFPSNDGSIRVEANGIGAGPITLTATCLDSDQSESEPFASVEAGADGEFTTNLDGKVNFKPQIWSEFSTKLYELRVDLNQEGRLIDTQTVRFGFREVSREGNKLFINGKPAFMRGNLECAVFPKTGHPPTTVEAWKKVWQTYLDHNLNHARFHSWCPPEAAFIAADEMGIYLQVEAPIWIDHWMTKPNPRPEMDTLGHPQGLGLNDRTTDAFALAEIRRTIDTYGNHPSFVFFAIGNELGTSDFEVTGTWMRDAKEHDPRHLYAASTARAITPFCDFNATHYIPDVGMGRQHLEFGTNWDYEDVYSKAPVPIIAHEIGQWPVYVDWEKELPKYTGPVKPYRLAEMAEAARANGLYDRSEELIRASGATNQLLYRDEIESFLRTPSCSGFQLLSMQDFSGQGEALIGWLDSFYDSKGTTDPAFFRLYCAPTVPLLKLPGYVFKNTDRPSIDALIHHYGETDIVDEEVIWQLYDPNGRTVDFGTLGKQTIPTGTVSPVGTITPNLSRVTEATMATLSISLRSQKRENIYRIWIYPEATEAAPDPAVVVTSDWEGEAKTALAAGKSVVLIANNLGGPAASKLAHWMPLYWSVPFFPGQSRETIGLRVSPEHPALEDFPTFAFGDWNWHRIAKGARGFDLTDSTPANFLPIAEPVTDFHLNRRLGSIFEAKVGAGNLLVCGYNISEAKAKELPEVAQLRRSLLAYAASSSFKPTTALHLEKLDKLFHDPSIKQVRLPERFNRADLYVSAASKLGSFSQLTPWIKNTDQVLRQVEGVNYSVESQGSWRDEAGSAWVGDEVTITITARAGVPGRFLARFDDWNKNGRTGTVTFEGKARQLGAHTDGVWLEFPVIREDTNDGRLILTAKALTGPNLMITDIAFIPEED